jgi:hypothetical protein
MPTISILILTYNSASYIEELFKSLFDKLKTRLDSGEYEIIIVDNDSKDETVTLVKELVQNKKNITVLESKENLGYAKGINKAAIIAKGELLIVINPDAVLLDEDFDGVFDEFKKEDKMAACGMSIEDFNGQKEKTAGNFFNPLTFFLYSVGLENLAGLRFCPDGKKKVDFVSGGFVAFRKSVFEKLGGFDEDYFMYVEDMDICYRAKKLGFLTYFLPLGTIKHKGQGSSSKEFAITNIYKGLVTFYAKHSSFFTLQYIKNLLSIKAASIIFIGTILGKKELVNTYTKALKTIE